MQALRPVNKITGFRISKRAEATARPVYKTAARE
jgi:hypothetical protein